MKKCFLLFLLAFASCAKSGDEILVGEYGSLTGGTATFGQSTHQGIMMASEELNQAGGGIGEEGKDHYRR